MADIKKILAEYWLSVLLVFVPVAFVLERMHVEAHWIFLASAVAIIPLAGWMGKSTEHLAERAGAGLGALLNATFGNAAELIIAIIALRAGLYDLVKASITGSIIGNILLVFGLAALLGGSKFQTQKFNATAAGMGATMLLLSAVALVIPAVFHAIVGDLPRVERNLSLDISIVLMVTYVLSLVFSLRTHAHLYLGGAAQIPVEGPPDTAGAVPEAVGAAHRAEVHHADDGHGDAAPWPVWKSLTVLLASAAMVGVMSELLVGATEETAQRFGMNEVFVGVILVALVGNAAEHSTAVLMAMKNKMDLALNIAVGSSIQVALFVAPLLVFLSYVIGPEPMDLLFTTLEVAAVGVSVLVMTVISLDGRSHWMEGVQLLAVYVILGIAFFFLPA